MSLVFLCMPSHTNQCDARAVDSIYHATGRHRVRFGSPQDGGGSPARGVTSLLCWNFNSLWAMAWNLRRTYRIDYFAMLHSDIEAEQGWLDVLIAELDRTGADLVSVVVPFKNATGATSTAVCDPADVKLDAVQPWEIARKLTMLEVNNLPETFGADDVEPGKVLLWNTGCWACRFDRPWLDARNPDGSLAFHFRNLDAIHVNQGEARAECRGEDWNASLLLHRLGGKALCTRKVRVTHHGHFGYSNFGSWEGSLFTDDNYAAHRARFLESKQVAVVPGQ